MPLARVGVQHPKSVVFRTLEAAYAIVYAAEESEMKMDQHNRLLADWQAGTNCRIAVGQVKKRKRAVKPMALHTWWTLISATRPRRDTVVALLVQSPEGIGAAEWTRRVPDVWVGEDGGDKG